MRIMIRCDIEGVSGVVHPSQASPHAVDYPYGVAMLHNDLAAVLDGIFSTGDHDVWIYDMHYYGRNLDLAKVDPRVKVVCGKPDYAPGDLGGLTAECDGQILLGLHSRAGTGALLAHTYEEEIQEMRLNGHLIGEIGLEAALAGELGVPTILVIGDSAGCDEARELLGEITTVAVKDSLSLHAGVCYPTEQTTKAIADGTRQAITQAPACTPWTVDTPVTLHLRLADSPFTDHVRTQLADAVLHDGTIRITAPTVIDAWQRYLSAKPRPQAATEPAALS